MIAQSSHPVAVIGGGPGGLASAMILAARGAGVTVYERGSRLGGRTSRISLEGSSGEYQFDRGPTFFMMPYVLEEIFALAGRRLHDYAELHPLDPMYRLIVGQEGADPVSLDTTQDLAEMARRIGAIDRRDGEAFDAFIRHNRRKLRLAEPILRRPIRGIADLMRLDTLKAGAVIKPHRSVYGLLSSYFRNPAVRLAMGFQSKYLGMSPYECPSLFTILPFIEYEYGIWHPKGGCNALIDAMAEVCLELGVRIETDSPVEEILFEGRQVTGVQIGGDNPRRASHSHTVVNADAGWALKNLVPERLRPGALSNAKIDAKRYSCSTYMMYLGVKGEVDLPHHTIYISESYRENIDDIAVRGRLSEDPSFYVCNPARIDPSMAPEGDSALYVLVPTPNCTSGLDWQTEAPALRQRTIDQLRRVAGLRDIEERIDAERCVTPADWASMNINHGATFSFAHNLGQMLHRRVHHKLRGFDGVWFVGGGTHPGSGLPVIFLSSQITSRMLGDELGLPQDGGGAAARTLIGSRGSSPRISSEPVAEPATV